MSKAFTKEDDAGLEVAARTASPPRTPITVMGRRALQERLAQAREAGDAQAVVALEARLAGGLVAPPADLCVATLGAEVTLRDGRGRVRVVRLVTPDEVGLVPGGATPASPLGARVVGARAGDAVELPAPDGPAEQVVVTVVWPR